jgi:hypothetical protein
MRWVANSYGRPARGIEGNTGIESGAMADFSQHREIFAGDGGCVMRNTDQKLDL